MNFAVSGLGVSGNHTGNHTGNQLFCWGKTFWCVLDLNTYYLVMHMQQEPVK
jgi:hypothetical protein